MEDQMKPEFNEKVYDLGLGWNATQRCDDDGHEEMVIYNKAKAVRIELPNASVKTLRGIFQSHQ
jgi:hypothetical protein